MSLGVNDRPRSQDRQRQAVRSYDGKVIGYLEGDTFVKRVDGSKHRLQKPPGWAVDARAYDEDIRTRATTFRVEDRETGEVFEASVAYFDEHKGEFDRRWGRQYYLPLSRWRVHRNGNGNRCRQLSLWGDNGQA